MWLAFQLGAVLDGEVISETIEWIPALGMDLDLRLDGFSALLSVLVAGIGVLVYGYAASYFAAGRVGLGRLVALLTLFAGSMFGLVVADNLIVLYGFWELTAITSFLLIGNSFSDGRARAAALQALLVTSAGALAMLAGFVIIGQQAGTYRMSELLADPPGGTAVEVALGLILIGAFTKSAQYPTFRWLPGAMVAPTPISAYLHSATMVNAGVYLIARFSPAFAEVDWWRPVVVSVGLYTLIAAGMRAMRQTDLKLLLAMSTVSQLGLMVAVFGLGTDISVTAGCELLLAHALAKAAAFMVVGILDHQHGTRDIRMLPRPTRGWGTTIGVTFVTAASMAGVPLVLGFIAKEEVLEAFEEAPGWAAPVALAAVVLGSAFSVAYSIRFAMGAIGRLSGQGSAFAAELTHGPPTPRFVAPAVVLSAVTVATGVVPGVLDTFIDTAASSLDPTVRDVHLAIWHGINQPLVWSLVAIAAGTAMFVLRDRVDVVLTRLQPSPVSSSTTYRTSLRSLNSDGQSGHRCRPVGLVADLPRRHPAHRGARARLAVDLRCVVAGVGRARRHTGARGDRRRDPRWGDRRCGCPAALHRRAVPRGGRLRDGWAVRDPGSARPRTHPDRHRIAHDGAVRARPAATPGSLRIGHATLAPRGASSRSPAWSG